MGSDSGCNPYQKKRKSISRSEIRKQKNILHKIQYNNPIEECERQSKAKKKAKGGSVPSWLLVCKSVRVRVRVRKSKEMSFGFVN